MIINLANGYYIDVDPLNYTLKQKYAGKKKDGTLKEADRTHGYYPTLESAVERFITLNQIDCGADLAVDLREYVEFVRDANLQAIKDVKKLLKEE